jgi:hypothetical protein
LLSVAAISATRPSYFANNDISNRSLPRAVITSGPRAVATRDDACAGGHRRGGEGRRTDGDAAKRVDGDARATSRRAATRRRLRRLRRRLRDPGTATPSCSDATPAVARQREAAQAFQRQNLDEWRSTRDRVLALEPGNQKAKPERERAIDLRKKLAEEPGAKCSLFGGNGSPRETPFPAT